MFQIKHKVKNQYLFYIVSFIVTVLLVVQSPVLAFSVTSPFGWRVHPISGEWAYHTGVDLADDFGAPIQAYLNGEVVFAGVYGGYGNAILLRHERERYTLYGHCSQLYVIQGQRVGSGEVIAAVGSTGNSTGPHLHLEYWVTNQYVDPILIWQGI